MKNTILLILCFVLSISTNLFAVPNQKTNTNDILYTIKIDGQISAPQLYILKRAIRTANADNAKYLIIDMNTPGGELQTTFKMMEALQNFEGTTICYVNTDAISAGSFIASACDKIIFNPKGVMGAAEAVTSTGSNVDESMQRKITSYISAKVRSINQENIRRADILKAMNNPDFELVIDDKIIKPKGELLTLTAKEATEIIGGYPLLADGIADNIQDLIKTEIIDNVDTKVVDVQITWAEHTAKYISSLSSILLGIGFALIVLDLKSGGLGILGSIGIGFLLIVFVGANISGVAGYEALIFFAIGIILILVEIFFLTGFIFPSVIGILLVFGSIIWAISDIWPARGLDYNFNNIIIGLENLAVSLVFTGILVALAWRFIPKSILFNKLVLNTGESTKKTNIDDIIGMQGIAQSELMPSGKILINGKIYEATASFAHIDEGDKVVVVEKRDFNYIVEKL